MQCSRCKATMYQTMVKHPEARLTWFPMMKCYACGDLIDRMVILNRSYSLNNFVTTALSTQPKQTEGINEQSH